jgi:hypothetical protein
VTAPADPRLRRHPLGFLEAVDRPTPEQLGAYYAETCYQAGQGGFRHCYSNEEQRVIRLRVRQRAVRAVALLGHDRPGTLLDVGCGEGFVLAEFARSGWEVAGMDVSIAGVEARNPHGGHAARRRRGDGLGHAGRPGRLSNRPVLAHPGSNYVIDPARGSDAHAARLRLEAVIGAVGVEAANRFYSALAEVGLGRNLTAFMRPSSQWGNQR